MKRIDHRLITVLLLGTIALPFLKLLKEPLPRSSRETVMAGWERAAFSSPAYRREPPRPEPRPIQEPKYQSKPRYALAVFGRAEHTRIWLVLDGHILYVDRNGSGDLTEPGKRLEPIIPKDGGIHIGNRWFQRHDDVYEFQLSPVHGKGSPRFCFNRWGNRSEWLEPGWENGTLWRMVGENAWAQNPVLFSLSCDEAQVCHFDGPVTFGLKMGERQRLKRGEEGSDLALYIGTPGRPARKNPFQVFSPLLCEEVPDEAYPVVDIEFPGKQPRGKPIRVRLPLEERC